MDPEKELLRKLEVDLDMVNRKLEALFTTPEIEINWDDYTITLKIPFDTNGIRALIVFYYDKEYNDFSRITIMEKCDPNLYSREFCEGFKHGLHEAFDLLYTLFDRIGVDNFLREATEILEKLRELREKKKTQKLEQA